MKQDRTRLPLRITFRDFWIAFGRTIVIWTIIILFVVIALHYEVDKSLIGGIVLIFGILTEAFMGLIGLISLIPVIGPIIAKVLALPVFWLINALGYFVSLIAIRKGYSRDVLNYRILTVVLLIGIVLGYILGKII